MKLLKLIPAAAIVLTAFTTFEVKADNSNYPSGWTKKKHCTSRDYYLLQRTDTPAAYGVWDHNDNAWSTSYVSFDDARDVYDNKCTKDEGDSLD